MSLKLIMMASFVTLTVTATAPTAARSPASDTHTGGASPQQPSHELQLHKRSFNPETCSAFHRGTQGYTHVTTWVGRFCDTCRSPRGFFDICWTCEITLRRPPGGNIFLPQTWAAAAAAGMPVDCMLPYVKDDDFMNLGRLPIKHGVPDRPLYQCPLGYHCEQRRDRQKNLHVVCAPDGSDPRKRIGKLYMNGAAGFAQIPRRYWNRLKPYDDESSSDESDESFDPSEDDLTDYSSDDAIEAIAAATASLTPVQKAGPKIVGSYGDLHPTLAHNALTSSPRR